ncbi:MAG: NAD(P)-binding protein, partial [Caulobacteraceae bacterium]|nr:NAD(P)-binding protein [Caulobacteraceae bacterium]
MTRFTADYRVHYWEEPIPAAPGDPPRLDRRVDPASGVEILTPRLAPGLTEEERIAALRALLAGCASLASDALVRWYYTPMMLAFSRDLAASRTVYDCMDELSAFRFAPPGLADLEQELLDRADVVFTGGYSLWEAKRDRHPNIHPFPSSVDRAHFQSAREPLPEPPDQAAIPHPRLGFYGVVDERMDLELLAAVADARPGWSLVILGPVVKIDEASLPRRPNIHYLGAKAYGDLPAYLAGWDVALMPFAINESTRFISPTKTPEYLAGGRPVVSTPIKDVQRHWGEAKGVFIAEGADGFASACDKALELAANPRSWRPDADRRLKALSWDGTHRAMARLIDGGRRRTSEGGAEIIDLPAPARSAPARPYDHLIVGAGFAGAVLAERLASGLGRRVLVVDRRPHVGGNAYDETNADGILVHAYGPHIFHTNSAEVFDYLSRFTRWRAYEHRVLARVDGLLVPIPINRTTINRLYGLDLATDEAAEAFLAERAEPVSPIRTSEDVVVAAVGRELYEKFFRGYTRKQWALDPSELDKSVTARVPTRTSTDDRYFVDRFQAMPSEGYTALFQRLLDHPLIEVRTGVAYEDIKRSERYGGLIYSGAIDAFFDRRFGPLPYRSLAFEHRTLDQEWFQDVATVNYPDEETPFTRITEFKRLTGQVHRK